MTTLRSEFLRAVEERGFLHQCTDLDGLDDALAGEGPLVAYIGFDCTADSLHVGSLVPIMLLRWLQKTGHKPIVLIGGGTTKIGDPSGKDESRQLLTEEQIAEGRATIEREAVEIEGLTILHSADMQFLGQGTMGRPPAIGIGRVGGGRREVLFQSQNPLHGLLNAGESNGFLVHLLRQPVMQGAGFFRIVAYQKHIQTEIGRAHV